VNIDFEEVGLVLPGELTVWASIDSATAFYLLVLRFALDLDIQRSVSWPFGVALSLSLAVLSLLPAFPGNNKDNSFKPRIRLLER
jgi:hypothetical protein